MRRFSILCVLCLLLAAALAGSATANAAVLIGDQNIESALDSSSAGSAEAFPFSQATAGTASSISVYVDSQNTATTLTAGLYSDSSGHPGALLASGSLAPKAGTWNTVSIASTAMSAGGTYWVAVLGNSGTFYFRDRNGGPCDSESSYQTNLSSLPSSWTSSVQWNTCPISAYVTGTGTATAAPVNTAVPAVSGTAMQGQSLSTSNGTWSNSPTSYAYQWQDCDSSGASCANVSGATSSSYTLTSGDAGHTVQAVVTASNAGGSASATSAQTATVAAPPQSTTVLFGDQNAASYADSNADGVAQAFSYTAAASGTTGDIHVYVNTGTTATKLFVGVYADSGGKPGSLLASGSISSPQAGAWNDVSVTSATITQGSTYWIALLGTGGQLNYLDTGSGSGASYVNSGASLSSLPATYASGNEWNASPASAYLSGALSTGGGGSGSTAPNNTALPTVSGTTTVGQTLTTTNGSWNGNPTSYAYQWQDCDSTGANCTNISGAVSGSYTLVGGDVGHTIRAVVTATNSGGSTSATSLQTAVITAPAPSPPSNTALPVVSGTTTQGQTLSTTNGAWTGSPTSYGYQWQDCNSSGGSCVNIAGATASTYTIVTADAGHTITAIVTASNASGSASQMAAVTGIVTSGGGQQTNCAGAPGSGVVSYTSMDACGYPSPNTTGPPNGTTFTAEPYAYTSDPPYNCSTNGPCTINAVSSSGLVVNTKNVTIQDSTFTTSGDSSEAIDVISGAANTVIKYDVFKGAGTVYPNTLTYGVYNQADNTLLMDHDLSQAGVERIWEGYAGGTLSNSFCDDTGTNDDAASAHYECVYTNGGPMNINHDTLINGHSQSAAINTDSGDTSNTLTNNLFVLGVGPFVIDLNPGTNIFTNNRIARQVYGGNDLWHVGNSGATYTATGNVWDDRNTTADCTNGGCG
jgi:hypothetical protein